HAHGRAERRPEDRAQMRQGDPPPPGQRIGRAGSEETAAEGGLEAAVGRIDFQVLQSFAQVVQDRLLAALDGVASSSVPGTSSGSPRIRLKAARPRERRDFTVPTGTPSIDATSS